MTDLTTYGPFKAHLCGGPFDDDYRRCPVAQFSVRGGRYQIREVNGDPVAHGTNGWVEFDWVAS